MLGVRSVRDIYAEIISAAHSGATGLNGQAAPSVAQLQAGNYRKGRVRVHGLDIAIETPQGQPRLGKSDGKPWSVVMAAHYGDISGTRGADGDPVDVFIGPVPESERVFVVNQTRADGSFDEHKVLLCFPSESMARTAYLASYERGWNRIASLVPCSIEQFKWWLKFGDTSKPLTLQALPYDGGNDDMNEITWDSAAAPACGMPQLLYRLRGADSDGLLLDAVSVGDILEDSDGELALDALVVEFAKVERKMAQMQAVMEAAGDAVKPLAVQVTPPFKQRGTTNVAAVFELSDGQTVSIFMHNPDTTPNKIAPQDELISWKWLLNKKDVTLVVAPEKGKDLNVREVGRRIMKLAERNSARFAQANAKRAERMANIDSLKTGIAAKEQQLAALDAEVADLSVKAEARRAIQVPQPDPVAQGGGAASLTAEQREWAEKTVANADYLPWAEVKRAREMLGLPVDEPEAELLKTPEGRAKLAEQLRAKAGKLTDEQSALLSAWRSQMDSYGWSPYGGLSGARTKVVNGTQYYAGWGFGDDGAVEIAVHSSAPGSTNLTMIGAIPLEGSALGIANAVQDLAVSGGVDPTSPEGYAKVMADPELQLAYQDRLDSFFQGRMVAIRNALRDLGWSGDRNSPVLTKPNGAGYYASVGLKPLQVGAGRNIVGIIPQVLPDGATFNDLPRDDLSKTPEQLAAEIDAMVQPAAPVESFSDLARRLVPAEFESRDDADGFTAVAADGFGIRMILRERDGGRTVTGYVLDGQGQDSMGTASVADSLESAVRSMVDTALLVIGKKRGEAKPGVQVTAAALSEATSKAIPFGKLYSDGDYRRQVANLTQALIAMGFKKWQADGIISSAKTIAARNANGRMNFLRPAEVVEAARRQGYVSAPQPSQAESQKTPLELAAEAAEAFWFGLSRDARERLAKIAGMDTSDNYLKTSDVGEFLRSQHPDDIRSAALKMGLTPNWEWIDPPATPQSPEEIAEAEQQANYSKFDRSSVKMPTAVQLMLNTKGQPILIEFDGKEGWSNGHILAMHKPKLVVDAIAKYHVDESGLRRLGQEAVARVVPKNATVQLEPAAHYRNEGVDLASVAEVGRRGGKQSEVKKVKTDAVVLLNEQSGLALLVDSKYFGYFDKQFKRPDYFVAPDGKGAIVVKKGGEIVGVMMPINDGSPLQTLKRAAKAAGGGDVAPVAVGWETNGSAGVNRIDSLTKRELGKTYVLTVGGQYGSGYWQVTADGQVALTSPSSDDVSSFAQLRDKGEKAFYAFLQSEHDRFKRDADAPQRRKEWQVLAAQSLAESLGIPQQDAEGVLSGHKELLDEQFSSGAAPEAAAEAVERLELNSGKPAASEQQPAEDSAMTEARTLLQSVIDGTANLDDPALADQLEAVHGAFESNAEMMALLEQAAQAYSDHMVARARAALA